MTNDRGIMESMDYFWFGGNPPYQEDNLDASYRSLATQFLDSHQAQQRDAWPYDSPSRSFSRTYEDLVDEHLRNALPPPPTPRYIYSGAFDADSSLSSETGFVRRFPFDDEDLNGWTPAFRVTTYPYRDRPNRWLRPNYDFVTSDIPLSENVSQRYLLDSPREIQGFSAPLTSTSFLSRERDAIESRIRALDLDIAGTNLRLAQESGLAGINPPCNVTSLRSTGAAYYAGTRSVFGEKPSSTLATVERSLFSGGTSSFPSTGRARYRLQETQISSTTTRSDSSVSMELAHRFHDYAKPSSPGVRPVRGRHSQRHLHRLKHSDASSVRRDRLRHELIGTRRLQNSRESNPLTETRNGPQPLTNRGMQPFTFDNGIYITPEIYRTVTEIYKEFTLADQGIPTFGECNYIVSFMKKNASRFVNK